MEKLSFKIKNPNMGLRSVPEELSAGTHYCQVQWQILPFHESIQKIYQYRSIKCPNKPTGFVELFGAIDTLNYNYNKGDDLYG